MARKLFFCIVLFFLWCHIHAQTTDDYTGWIKKATAFYDTKKYQLSADAYTHAFALNDGDGWTDDCYNAACVWSLARNKDSAFFLLNRIVAQPDYTDYLRLVSDTTLNNLYNDKRWLAVCELVKQNKDNIEGKINRHLIALLDTVYQNDQQYRGLLDSVEGKYGYKSKELIELWKTINLHDSINEAIVENILNNYGWLGADVIGGPGNFTLYAVIQHADIKAQEKYLPMMREAVRNKKASSADLAYLEDRVALREGKRQIYGTQLMDSSGHYWVSPMEDPDNVDKRRAEVGLGPIAEYIKHYIVWNLEEYKKQLPEIEKRVKELEKKENGK